MTKRDKIGIVGLGLIGGSIALALNKKYEVVGMSRSASTVEYALKEGIISSAAEKYDDFKEAKAVFVCVPLTRVKDEVSALYDALGDSVIITDVGSVKGMLSGQRGRIIGGHPMAGTEQSGIHAAREKLLDNAYYILVDYNGNEADLAYIKELVRSMGALPREMTASEHDALVAKISHLEHMAAYSMVNAVLDGDDEIVGSGFMDVTRIASSDPELWNAVSALNRDNIVSELGRYIEILSSLRGDIAAGKDVTPFFSAAKEKRDRLTYRKKFLSSYILYVDVSDAKGSIVAILSKLAEADISINNLTVVNSRAGVGGALRLEFKDERDYIKAKEILR